MNLINQKQIYSKTIAELEKYYSSGARRKRRLRRIVPVALALLFVLVGVTVLLRPSEQTVSTAKSDSGVTSASSSQSNPSGTDKVQNQPAAANVSKPGSAVAPVTAKSSASAPVGTNSSSSGGASTPSGPVFPRGIWIESYKASDADLNQVKALGYTFVFTKPTIANLDRLQSFGLKAMIWLDGYQDGNDALPNCIWRSSDATITNYVNTVKNHPATGYYFIDDEPHANAGVCADTPGQIRARNALIKSLDPNHPTFITENRTADYAALANSTDILGLIGYPCNYNNLASCDATNIPGRISAANAAGVNHYWEIPEVYNEQTSASCSETPYYRAPTPSEYVSFESQWKAAPSRVEGSFAFMWGPVFPCGNGLQNHPELWNVIKGENGV